MTMNYMTDPELRRKFDEAIESFTLFDDFFMSIVFKDNADLAAYVLRIILGKPELHVISVQTQDGENNLFGRSARFDVLAADETGSLYHIEMENTENGADPHRAAFYSAVMVVKSTERGKEKVTYPENYTIFFTRRDFFGTGDPVYLVDRFWGREKMPFRDDIHIVYVNGAYRDEQTVIGQMVHDFHCKNPEEMYSREIADSVRRYKSEEGGQKEMCEQIRRLMEEGRAVGREEGRAVGREEGRAVGREEGRAEGRVEGRTEGIVDTLSSLVKDGLLSLREAADRAGLTEEAFRKKMMLNN